MVIKLPIDVLVLPLIELDFYKEKISRLCAVTFETNDIALNQRIQEKYAKRKIFQVFIFTIALFQDT